MGALTTSQAEVDFDWAQAVSDFRDRLRGDLSTEELGPMAAVLNGELSLKR